MLGIGLALCVSFLKALGELAGKAYTDVKKENTLDEYHLIFGVRIFSVILLLPLIFFLTFPQEISLSLIGVILLSSLVNSTANITSLKAVKHGELSIVGPLTAVTLPFLLLSSYLINNESVNAYGFLGVIAIFCGTYFLGVSDMRKGFFAPIRALQYDMGARYMFFTAILWSIGAPLDKIGVTEIGILTWMFLTNIITSILLGVYILTFRRNFTFATLSSKKYIQKSASITLLGGATVFLQMLALKYTLVVYVIAIKRASGIFSIMFGYLFYKEKNIFWKLVAVSIMIAGVALITLLGNI